MVETAVLEMGAILAGVRVLQHARHRGELRMAANVISYTVSGH